MNRGFCDSRPLLQAGSFALCKAVTYLRENTVVWAKSKKTFRFLRFNPP